MQNNKKIRLVVDSNIWISALWSQDFQIRTNAFFKSENCLVFSEMLFYELDKTIRKPHLAKKISQTNYVELVSKLRTVTKLVDVRSKVEICRDPKDNYLLALAKDGDADYLITGDYDLLVLEEFGKTKIVMLSDFEVALH